MVKAAVLTQVNEPLEILDDVVVEAPHEGELLVRIAASGVCHSDLSMQNGTVTPNVPMILGHEAAGVVEGVGAGVTAFSPGDHVVLAFVARCGDCYFCTKGQPYLCTAADMGLVAGFLPDGTTRSTSGDTALSQMCGCGTFSETTVVPEINAVKIDPSIDLHAAALIGCGVLTGVGAALNTADVQPGDVVAVLGCGGVGLNVIQGARIAGASEIIAIDLSDKKLQMTKEFGATAMVNPTNEDPIAAVQRMTDGRGADVAFEVIGIQPTIDQALGMTRRGGQTVLVGMPSTSVMVNVPAMLGLIYGGRTIKGCWYGSSDVARDVPKLLDLYASGQLKLDELISAKIALEGVNDAFETMKTGEVARSLIVY